MAEGKTAALSGRIELVGAEGRDERPAVAVHAVAADGKVVGTAKVDGGRALHAARRSAREGVARRDRRRLRRPVGRRRPGSSPTGWRRRARSSRARSCACPRERGVPGTATRSASPATSSAASRGGTWSTTSRASSSINALATLSASTSAARLVDISLVDPVSIYHPYRCATVCQGVVEVYRRTCCCEPPIVIDPGDYYDGPVDWPPRHWPPPGDPPFPEPFPPQPGSGPVPTRSGAGPGAVRDGRADRQRWGARHPQAQSGARPVRPAHAQGGAPVRVHQAAPIPVVHLRRRHQGRRRTDRGQRHLHGLLARVPALPPAELQRGVRVQGQAGHQRRDRHDLRRACGRAVVLGRHASDPDVVQPRGRVLRRRPGGPGRRPRDRAAAFDRIDRELAPRHPEPEFAGLRPEPGPDVRADRPLDGRWPVPEPSRSAARWGCATSSAPGCSRSRGTSAWTWRPRTPTWRPGGRSGWMDPRRRPVVELLEVGVRDRLDPGPAFARSEPERPLRDPVRDGRAAERERAVGRPPVPRHPGHDPARGRQVPGPHRGLRRRRQSDQADRIDRDRDAEGLHLRTMADPRRTAGQRPLVGPDARPVVGQPARHRDHRGDPTRRFQRHADLPVPRWRVLRARLDPLPGLPPACPRRLRAIVPAGVFAVGRQGHRRRDAVLHEWLCGDRANRRTRSSTTTRRRSATCSGPRRSVPSR